MPDGSQHTFNFPSALPTSQLRPGEIIVDLFAGGGGASEALRQALGRDPDIAINHDPVAIGLHAANHPLTKHLQTDVWHDDPVREVSGRRFGWFHASPDCTHFSQAKGGQPRSRVTRSLSWVVLKWAGSLASAGNAPRIISLENVEQILTWGPLIAKRCKTTRRVVKLDGTIADKGEQVSVWNQQLVPDKRNAGRTWSQFIDALRAIGYTVEWRKLIASDYGAGTSRKRLFLIARHDGQPITWPDATHGKTDGLLPLVTAADCIDFTVPCPSIFTRKKPLASATMRRIAKGTQRYVIDAAEPFIVQCANASANGVASASHPLGTVTAQPKGGSHAVVVPTLVGVGGRAAQTDQRPGNESLITITSKADCAVVTAFLEQANGGGPNGKPARARACAEPVSAITASGSQQRLVTAHLTAMAQNVPAVDPLKPLPTVLAGATRYAVIECTLSPEHEADALRVAAFLINYYGNGTALDLREPLDTVTTRDRIALVTVTIKGTPYVIVDIGLRMLRREELFRAQGFPADYIIDRIASGQRLTISQSVRMVGNSVSPPPLCALARANLDPVKQPERIAA